MALQLKTKCPETGKARFRTELDAKIVLAEIQRVSSKHRKQSTREVPCRVIRCQHCGYWELTSRSDRHLQIVRN